MKKHLLAAASVISLLSAPALAADAPNLIVNPAPVYDNFDWSGFYIGINGGVGQGTFAHPFSITGEDEEGPFDILGGSIDVTAGGFIGGAQAGYNVQLDGFVLGIEGDVQASSVDGRVTLAIEDIEIDAGTRLDYFGTLRGRAGVTLDRALVYATAGLAWGRTTSSINASPPGGPISDDLTFENDRFGWSAGVGLEYALADNITFKTEYLYTDLGSEEIVAGEIGDGIFGKLDSDVAFHTVRAGLNFKF